MNSVNFNSLTLKQYLTTKGLTPRQIDVATIALTQKSCKEMAAALFVAPKTIKFHLTSIYAKFNIRGRHGLILQLKDYVVSEYPEIKLQDEEPVVVKVPVELEGIDYTPHDLPRGVFKDEQSTTTSAFEGRS